MELCVRRAEELCDEYNHKLSGGKWNHFMDEIYIGYRSWNNPPRTLMPQVTRVSEADAKEGEELTPQPEVLTAVMEASDFVERTDAKEASWQVIPHMGVWQDAVALLPYTKSTGGASITYEFTLDAPKQQARAVLTLATNFPFNDGRGQRLAILIDGCPLPTLNVNEASRYVVQMAHDQNFEWETTRQNRQPFTLPSLALGKHRLTLQPLDPGIVIERIVVE